MNVDSFISLYFYLFNVYHRLVQEELQMSLHERIRFKWHRLVRGRSYRHLLKEVGYK